MSYLFARCTVYVDDKYETEVANSLLVGQYVFATSIMAYYVASCRVRIIIILISVSVCLYVCLFVCLIVCPLAYLKNYPPKLHQIC